MSDTEDRPEWVEEFAAMDQGDVFSVDIEDSENGYEGATITMIRNLKPENAPFRYVTISDDDVQEYNLPTDDYGECHGFLKVYDPDRSVRLFVTSVSIDADEPLEVGFGGGIEPESIDATDVADSWTSVEDDGSEAEIGEVEQ